MRRHFQTALVTLLLFTVLTGVGYPLLVTGLAQTLFPHQANGSLVRADGRVVGSSLLAQDFSSPSYFWPRPSSTDANTGLSGGSNLGPSNPAFLATVAARVVAYRRVNGLSPSTPVPVDAVTASGSGLDPDISLANALDQAGRVARARHVARSRVVALIYQDRTPLVLGVMGTPAVNVLQLNIDLTTLTP